MTAFKQGMFRLLIATGLADSYWNSQMKKNGAYERRFDQPYQP